jgi:hypothetical protein
MCLEMQSFVLEDHCFAGGVDKEEEIIVFHVTCDSG